MKLETLRDLYVEELRDIYDAEHQLLKALPKMAKSASSPELKSAFEDHLQKTEQQVNRLEEIFDKLGLRAKGKKCEGMKGIIDEGKEMMSATDDDDVLDAGLIAAAQKVEHYEIASYGCVRTYAEQLGHGDQAELLQQSLDEEKEADQKLSELATESINLEAQEPDTGTASTRSSRSSMRR